MSALGQSPSFYPRVYEPTRLTKLFWSAAGVTAVIVGSLVIWGALQRPEPRWGPLAAPVRTLMGAVLGALGLTGVLGALRWKILLWPDRLVAVGLIGRRTIVRSQVRAFRIANQGTFPRLKLYPSEPNVRPVSVTLYDVDQFLEDWLEDLRNLDEDEIAAREIKLLERPELGNTPDQRRRNLHLYRRTAGIVSLFGWPIFLWCLLGPWPYELAVGLAILAPLVAIALAAWSDGVISVGAGARNDPRPNLALLTVAGLGVPYRAFIDVHLLDWRLAMLFAAMVALVLVALAWAIDRPPSRRPWQMALGLVGAFVYGWGVVVEANAKLDPSVPVPVPMQVLGRRVYDDSGSRNVELTLEPRQPVRERIIVSAPRRMFDNVRVGQKVCVQLHRGALHIRWYEVDRCGMRDFLRSSSA